MRLQYFEEFEETEEKEEKEVELPQWVTETFFTDDKKRLYHCIKCKKWLSKEITDEVAAFFCSH